MPDFFLDESELPAKRPKSRKPRGGCGACGLDRHCISPQMQPYGEGDLRIAVVGEAPGEKEDQQGRPFIGAAGQFLRQHLSNAGIDLDRDCVTTNAVLCRPTDGKGDNREPTAAETMACRRLLDKFLDATQPDMIIALGGTAIQAVLSDAPFSPSATQMHGRIVPCPARQCWVACGFHPSYYLHEKGKYDLRMAEFCDRVVEWMAEHGEWTDLRLDPSAYEIVENIVELDSRLAAYNATGHPVAFDYETTCLSPWDERAKLLTCAFADSPDRGWCLPLYHPQASWDRDEIGPVVLDILQTWLAGPCPKVIQNWQFEEIWSQVHLGVGINNVVADTMVVEHVLDNRRGVCGQEFSEYVRYGESAHKGMVNVTRLKDEFLDTVARYNVLDVRYDIRIHHDQQKELPNEF